jgi:hypothetical protein
LVSIFSTEVTHHAIQKNTPRPSAAAMRKTLRNCVMFTHVDEEQLL